MGQIILSNVKLWVAGYDMSGKLNAIALDDKPDVLDNTTFGCTAKNRKKGLPVVTAALAGFFEAEETDEYFSNFVLTDVPMTIAPTSILGGPAYSFLSRNTEYNWGGMVGEMGKFNVKAESVGTKMIRGRILENGSTPRIITAHGTAFNFGVVAEEKNLYGVIHVVNAAKAAGDTLDVIIESDSAEGFDVSPETQISFAQVLGNGGGTYEWKTKAGPITDTWWRTSWTVASVDSPSFIFAVFMGID
jgi:hypothetical protein